MLTTPTQSCWPASVPQSDTSAPLRHYLSADRESGRQIFPFRQFVSLITINSDGALEQVDTLRSAYAGAVGIGLNVHTHGLDAAIADPAIVARQRGRDGLAAVCQKCSLHQVCGGLYTHRYSAENGFMNPSIYCRELSCLIRHIHRRVSQDVARLRAGDI
jgi:uncharacterized protein